MEKITKLLSAQVVNEEGMCLGRVIDLRSDGDPDHGIPNKNRPVTELLYGRNGLLQVIGFQKAEIKIIPWRAVKKFSRGQVVVKMSDLE